VRATRPIRGIRPSVNIFGTEVGHLLVVGSHVHADLSFLHRLIRRSRRSVVDAAYLGSSTSASRIAVEVGFAHRSRNLSLHLESS
jgi:hypothetical protein